MTYRPTMLLKVRSEAIMAAPKIIRAESGQPAPCCARIASFIPGMTCAGDDTTVMCHLWGHGKGTSTKTSDLGAIIACQTCHDLMDMRDPRMIEAIARNPMLFLKRLTAAQIETLSHLVQHEIIFVPDAETV